MDGVSLAKYRIVRKGQFSFNPNTARMGDKIPIALNEGKDCLVSQIYPVFKIIDEKTLLPEFLFYSLIGQNLIDMLDTILGEVQEKHLIGMICVMLKFQFQILKFKNQ